MSPKGDYPGFVRVLNDKTIAIPVIQCTKALVRSKLWLDEYRIDRNELPSLAEILRDHAGLADCDVDVLQKEIDERVATTLH